MKKLDSATSHRSRNAIYDMIIMLYTILRKKKMGCPLQAEWLLMREVG
jgi:hypothetical protein